MTCSSSLFTSAHFWGIPKTGRHVILFQLKLTNITRNLHVEKVERSFVSAQLDDRFSPAISLNTSSRPKKHGKLVKEVYSNGKTAIFFKNFTLAISLRDKCWCSRFRWFKVTSRLRRWTKTEVWSDQSYALSILKANAFS